MTNNNKVYIHIDKIVDMDYDYTGQSLLDWEKSEQGQWVKKHSLNIPTWNKTFTNTTYYYDLYVSADLNDEDYIYFKLKWPDERHKDTT